MKKDRVKSALLRQKLERIMKDDIKEVLKLRYEDNKSFREIADIFVVDHEHLRKALAEHNDVSMEHIKSKLTLSTISKVINDYIHLRRSFSQIASDNFIDIDIVYIITRRRNMATLRKLL